MLPTFMKVHSLHMSGMRLIINIYVWHKAFETVIRKVVSKQNYLRSICLLVKTHEEVDNKHIFVFFPEIDII